ncbi:hypothetical protein [Nocardia wallacei]|uniref:Uncharacterized protein n=1 Tax=Nocardia wallacei TaxID=480035 RepID=A0A7G1KQ44_9NOCA|nr:hypothetical protein [Nocardia wallacei]BCK57388.1 hypothetical protein NWFMUON74_51600 [Nocardia wallacei]
MVNKVQDSGTDAKTPTVDRSGEDIDWQIASGTLIQKNHDTTGKLCDFLVSRESRDRAYITVELKSRVQDVRSIIEQVQNGANILNQCGEDSQQFFAVLIKSRGISPHAYKILKAARINYRGRKFMIRVEKSGFDLSQL